MFEALNISELHLNLPEEKWVLVEGESAGHPYFMMVNDGLKYFEGKDDYCYCLIATVELNDMQGHRLPTDEEAEVLNRMEDILISELSHATLPLQVGRETYFGVREILVYFPKLSDYKSTVDSLSKKLNELRSTHLELHHDPIWKNAGRYHGPLHNA